MDITATNLNLYFTALETTFNHSKELAPVVANRIATTYPVATEQWANAWIGMLAKYREWIGPRYVEVPAPQTYIVPIQKFEKTDGISRTKFLDDTYGIYTPVAQMFGQLAAKWPDYQLRDLLQSQGSQTGARQLSLDGLNHWGTAHPVDFYDSSKGTYPNDYTGGAVTVNGQVIGGALTGNSMATVFQDMARRKNESVEAGGFAPDLLLSGAMQKFTASTILQAQFMGLPIVGNLGTGNVGTAGSPLAANSPMVGATENVLKGWLDYLMWEDLGGSVTVGNGTQDLLWYELCTSKPIKPFSWLLREAPDFVARTQPDDPAVFDTDTYLFGSKARGAPAWGFEQMSSRSGA